LLIDHQGPELGPSPTQPLFQTAESVLLIKHYHVKFTIAVRVALKLIILNAVIIIVVVSTTIILILVIFVIIVIIITVKSIFMIIMASSASSS